MFASARNLRILSTLCPVTFQTRSNLRWQSSKHCPFSYPDDLRSFKQSTEDYHTPSALPTQCLSQFCLLKAFRSQCHLSLPRNLLWTTQKHECVTWCNLNTFAKVFKSLWHSFPQRDKKFLVYSFLRAHSWTTCSSYFWDFLDSFGCTALCIGISFFFLFCEPWLWFPQLSSLEMSGVSY